jgi:uncharacterized protein (DUF1778 family)
MAAAPKNERIDLRVAHDVKEQIQKAAALVGESISTFVQNATISRASKVIETAQALTLSDRDRDRFLAALDRDDEPSAALRKAARRHKDAITSRG